MAIEPAPWRPAGEMWSAPQRRLAANVREALPTRDARGTAEWERGERRWQAPARDGYAEPGAPCEIVVTGLTWHIQETLECDRRAMSAWRFQGVAWWNGGRVDFRGECVRDLTTGCFWEMQLHTVGLTGT